MSKFLTFKLLTTKELMTINVEHIVYVMPSNEGGSKVHLSSGKTYPIETEFDVLSMTLESI